MELRELETFRAVIESGGGLYEDTRSGKRRYWIPTAGVSTGEPATTYGAVQGA